jgi:hypothetical protein
VEGSIESMNVTEERTTLSWWRIVVAVILGMTFSYFSLFLLTGMPENALFVFLTDSLKFSGNSGGIFFFSLFLLITTSVSTLFGVAIGRSPRFLYGQITGITVFCLQIGIWLITLWFFARYQ